MTDPDPPPTQSGRGVSGTTRVAAVIGDPVRHSRSPKIHNAAFAATGLDWVYVALPVADGQAAAALEGMRALGIEGLSVTTPHKAAVAAAVDDRSPAVAALGACNTVVREGRTLIGHNTDGSGFVSALRAGSGVAVEGARVVVLGAGGAARAIVWAVADAGAGEVLVVNRSSERAATAAELHPRAVVARPDDIAGADIVVNATSVGMTGGPAPQDVPIPIDLIDEHMFVADIVYQPLETPFMTAARQRGADVVGGLGMLIHQAAAQFELWTGQPAPLEAMAAAVRNELAH